MNKLLSGDDSTVIYLKIFLSCFVIWKMTKFDCIITQ